MSFRLYVGNYPSDFTQEDIEKLFSEFEGIEVDKVLKKNTKCYSFLICEDIDQLVSVIKKMNKKMVSGRRLIVRASDANLQEYVDLILQNEESCLSEDTSSSSPTKVPFVPVQVMKSKYRQPHRSNNYEKSASSTNLQDSSPKSDENHGGSADRSNYSLSSLPNQQKHVQNKVINNVPNKFDSINLQKNSPKTDENQRVSANRSNYSSRSMYSPCKHEASDLETSANDSGFTSKGQSKVYNQRKSTNNYESNFENSDNMHNKFGSSSLQKISSKIEENRGVSANGSSKSMHSPHKHGARERENSANGSGFTSNTQSQLHINQRKSANNYMLPNYNPHSSKNPSNSYQAVDSEYFENDSNCSSKSLRSNSSGINVQSSRYNEYFSQRQDSSSPTWVSVTNFRFGTHYTDLFELFSDYSPLHVRMICNYPCEDSLCEALVCFPSRDIADDVIMNFDNTIFQGRIILVNDAEDLTIMNELLSVANT